MGEGMGGAGEVVEVGEARSVLVVWFGGGGGAMGVRRGRCKTTTHISGGLGGCGPLPREPTRL